MEKKNSNLRITKNKWDGTLDTPRFSLCYGNGNDNANSKKSYNILTALKGENDIIMEVNTSLAAPARAVCEDSFMDFIKKIRSFELNYSYRKVPPTVKQSFLAQLFAGGKKDNTAHELLTYIPDYIWKKESFYNLIPTYGVRYYILNTTEKSDKILEKILNFTDPEKLEYFKLIIFDISSINQMGIVTSYLTDDDIRTLLAH